MLPKFPASSFRAILPLQRSYLRSTTPSLRLWASWPLLFLSMPVLEDPENSRTVVGKLKGYQRQSSDLWEIDNKIYDWKILSVKAKFDISDYLYGRRSDKEKLVRDLKTATRKSDQASLAVNAIAKKNGQSYKVHSCRKLADKL